jgi:drug/metabolite transporter (DMT)-like permease
MKWRTWAAFAAVGILWGSGWIVTPTLPLPELLAGAVRFAIAAALLGLAILILRIRPPRPFPLAPSVLLGITMAGLPYALAVWAKDSVSAGLVAVLYAAMPLAALFLSRNIFSSSVPALVIGMGGVTFLVAQGISSSPAQFKGAVLLAFAVSAEAFSYNYAKSCIGRGTFVVSSAIQCAVASLLLAFLSAVTGRFHPALWNRQSFVALAAVAAVEGAIGLPLLYWLLARIESWQAATLQWLSTLVAVAEAACFLRAKSTLDMAAGAIMILAATFWSMQADQWDSDSAG